MSPKTFDSAHSEVQSIEAVTNTNYFIVVGLLEPWSSMLERYAIINICSCKHLWRIHK